MYLFQGKIDVINNTNYEYKPTDRSQPDVYNNALLDICLLLPKKNDNSIQKGKIT